MISAVAGEQKPALLPPGSEPPVKQVRVGAVAQLSGKARQVSSRGDGEQTIKAYARRATRIKPTRTTVTPG
jgi:hypothetical protein